MNTIVAVPLDEDLASFIGKRGSSNSITFFNRKSENDVIVVLFPSQEDEKIHALAESLLVSSQILLSTSHLDRRFGEALIASSLLDRKFMLTADNEVGELLHGSGIGKFSIVSREDALQSILENVRAEDAKVQVRVDIDKAFPVKGIGTVILGIVTKGVLKQHDKLYHTSGKEVSVRSIQSQDEDILSAGIGTRVGISLKGIEADEISKGDLLTGSQVPISKRVVVDCRSSRAANEKVEEGSIYGVALGFSFTECTLIKVGGSELEIKLRSPVPVEIGDELLLIRRQVPRIFASGVVKQRFQ
ncbi:MAG: EF-Tu/IF-2/RF-3 family GTPase [Candidatus Micrarchaeales archaeon]|jgi:selenocysteine-specific translation elongation factor